MNPDCPFWTPDKAEKPESNGLPGKKSFRFSSRGWGWLFGKTCFINFPSLLPCLDLSFFGSVGFFLMKSTVQGTFHQSR